jgi:hypothetical protein
MPLKEASMSKRTISREFFRSVRANSHRLLVLAFAVTGLTISAWAWLMPAGKSELAASVTKVETVAPPAPAQSISSQERLEAEIITIRPTGFEPKEINRREGRFLLTVENRSGLEEVSLRLDREAGSRQREARVRRNKLDWREIVNLPPGRYTLTEADHPDWICHIIISAN